MKPSLLPLRHDTRRGYTMLELLVTVSLVAVVAAVVAIGTVQTTTGVTSAKLQSDVQKLNQIVSVYLSQGGSLDSLTTPQAVIDKLKTVQSSSETGRNVGVMTGQGVDLRLTAQMQTASETSAAGPRVVWDSTNKKFVYTETAGVAGGVASFALTDSLAANAPSVETRTRSNVLYNNTNGWVWSSGSYLAMSPVGPADQPVTDVSNTYDPGNGVAPSGGSGSGGGGGGQLPSPIISPTGGVYPLNLYPTLIYINPNGAPDGSSILEYRLNGGPWIVYTGPFSVDSGTKVEAKNFSTNATSYSNSNTDVESFYFLVPSFTGTVAAKWNKSDGSASLVLTINNSNPDSVTETDGTASSGANSNVFDFSRVASFGGVPPNQEFKIGQLTYTNGTILSGTGSTGLHLHLDITMSSPSVATTGADINIALNNTTNTSDAAASADIATLSNPITNYAVVLNGVTYTLWIHYGAMDVSQGFVDNNNHSMHVYESATGTVPVIASFVSSTPN